MKMKRLLKDKKKYLEFLQKRYLIALDKFNDNSEPESKDKKWIALRLEKVIKLIQNNPDYKLGTCFSCKKRIPLSRLEIDPETIWCVGCATEHEFKFRHKGGHWHFPLPKEDQSHAVQN